MIVFTCPVCNRVRILRHSKTLFEIQCTCEAVYRIQISQLHEGKSQKYADKEAALAYTYDTEGNRVTLSDMRRQTAAVQQLRPGVDSSTPDGRSPSGDSK